MYPSILPYSGHNPKSLSFTELAYSLNLWKALGGSGARGLGGSVARWRKSGPSARTRTQTRTHVYTQTRTHVYG